MSASSLQGRRTNLHQLWDTRVVEVLGRARGADRSGYRRQRTARQQRKAWQAGTPVSWADESHRIARDHDLSHGGGAAQFAPVTVGYLRSEIPTTRQQLAKAGLRLAWMLNDTLR
jgi:hypothetical protein